MALEARIAGLCLAMWMIVGVGHATGLQVVDGKVRLSAESGGTTVTLLNGLTYAAEDASGLVFQTSAASLSPDGALTFTLTGPGAAEVELSARITPVARGVLLDWLLTSKGASRKWRSAGFQFDFASPVTAARTRPLVRWVQPTGREKWEVAGDTPYPTTEWQWREADLGDSALVMLSPDYDPDWIYGNQLDRAAHWSWAPPAEPGEKRLRMGLFAAPRGQLQPATVAATAAGRPLAIGLTTGRVGNLFKPGETALVTCTVSNATEQPQAGSLLLEGYDYAGRRLGQLQRPLKLAAMASEAASLPVSLPGRGLVFIAAHLTWPGGETVERTNVGFLPERPVTPAPAASPFALSGLIAAPERYPDQYDLATVLDLAQRIGVRWVRGGWVPLEAAPTAADEAQAHRRFDQLHARGILPYPQAGAGIPKPEELPAFRERPKVSLQHFSWVSPYLEVGNELNYGAGAVQYVQDLLKPVHDCTREVFPQAKIVSMGLGGVGADWLADFVKAGGMDLVDVLSIHPGCHPRAPEFWEGWRGWVFRSQVQDALKAARTAGKDVWITEAYAPTVPQRSQVDPRTSADYLVRTYVCSLAVGVKLVAWYQFQDGVWFAQRPNPDDMEYNYGMVYTDLTPKPAYVAYGAMTEQLEGAVYQGRIDLGAPDLYGVRFLKDGQPLDVLWSYREKHETDLPWWPEEKYLKDSRKPGEPWQERWHAPVQVSLPAAEGATVTDLMGNTQPATVLDGKVSLALSGSPVYVRGLKDVAMLKTFWDEIP